MALFIGVTATVERIMLALRELFTAGIAEREEKALSNFDGQDGDVDVPRRLDQHFEDGQWEGVVLWAGPVDVFVEDVDVGNPDWIFCPRVDEWVERSDVEISQLLIWPGLAVELEWRCPPAIEPIVPDLHRSFI